MNTAPEIVVRHKLPKQVRNNACLTLPPGRAAMIGSYGFDSMLSTVLNDKRGGTIALVPRTRALRFSFTGRLAPFRSIGKRFRDCSSEQLLHRMPQMAEVHRAVGGGVEWLRAINAEFLVDRRGVIFRRIRVRDHVASVAI